MGEEKHTVPAIRKEWYNGYLIVLTMDHDAVIHAAVYSNGESPKSHVFTYSKKGSFEEEVMKLIKEKINKKIKFE